jgi:dTDP-4-amino-4,6-dideoxygalactose transaminase
VGVRSVWHCYVIQSDDRDGLRKRLNDRGIMTQVHYSKALHQYARWRYLGNEGRFPVSERLAATVVSLPCYAWLTDEEQTAVIEAVKEST